MTDLRQAAQALLNRWDSPLWKNGSTADAIADLRTALEQQAEPVAVYGYCPDCGAKGVTRERRANGDDKCTNGHTYPSSTATPVQPLLMNHNGAVRKVHGYPPQQQAEPVASIYVTLGGDREFDDWKHELPVGRNFLYTAPPQRKWVGLTEAERIDIIDEEIASQNTEHFALAQAIETKLKENNT